MSQDLLKVKLPKKLKDDSIFEALCEIRFESSTLPDISVARLVDCAEWEHLKPTRTNVADIPAPIRASDPHLKIQPLFILKSEDGKRQVRIGERMISMHVVGEYCGGDEFKRLLGEMYQCLFDKTDNTQVKRMGFRYVNALTSSLHGISNLNDLIVQLSAGENDLTESVNLNFLSVNDDLHRTMTRIATPGFIHGNIPQQTSIVIDVDVFTSNEISFSNINEVTEWTNKAHIYEKEAFFSLIPQDRLNELVEEWE